MKTLYIVRHAKSSWDNPMIADFKRPLNERGLKDAPRMGKRLKEKAIHPNAMITSPAVRAIETCKAIASAIQFSQENIMQEAQLYHASAEAILNVIRRSSAKTGSQMLFGHNPGLTDFVNMMCPNADIENIPTCGVVGISFHTDAWIDISDKNSEVLFFDYPKNRKG
jgi:phosphohistidine phosphatase